jgi:hypothetical protein
MKKDRPQEGSDGWQDLPAGDLAALTEWYVAEGESTSYVGPIDAVELERLWTTSEIDLDTRVWTPGAAEWQPIREVRALVFLEALPRNVQKDIAWRSLDAVDLGELAQAELSGEIDAPKAPPAPTLAESLDLPALVKRPTVEMRDPFGDWWSDPSRQKRENTLPAPWRVATPSRRLWPVVVIGLGVAATASAATWAAVVSGTIPAGLLSRVSLSPTADGPDAAKVEPKIVALSPSQPEERVITPKPTRAERLETPERTRIPLPDDDGEGAADPLTPQGIIKVVRSNGASLAPCFRAAKLRGEIVPQQYTFVLDWRIRQSGAVTGVMLKEPTRLANSGLASCLAAAMNDWTFPAPGAERAVSNFPMTITVR